MLAPAGSDAARAPDWPALRGPSRAAHGLLDVRAQPGSERAPSPLAPGDAAIFLRARASGSPFREAYEELLRAVAEERADRLTQLAKESRGAWLSLLRSSGGHALFAGNSLTGAAVPLAAAGFRVTLLDPAPERLRLALAIAEEKVPGRVRGILGGDAPELPFGDASFDLVVLEDGLGEQHAGRAPSLAECRRATRGELLVLADNRLGYKRSSGRYGDFRVPGPLEYARAALRPPSGERTLAGYRRLLAAPGFAPPEAFALYAHRRDFAQVVALDEPRPSLAIGPSERRNRLKTAAHALGLFPVFTPSFAFVCARDGRARGPRRIERVLAALSELTGEPLPRIEHLIGTRGNTSVIHTALPGASVREPAGRWTLHLALDQRHRRGLALHVESLARVRRDFPAVPVPEPLFAGEVEGLWLTCERRLPGVACHHLARDAARADRLLAEVGRQLAELVVERPAPFLERDFDAELEPRFELLLRCLPEPETRRALAGLRARARRELVGRTLPRVFAHADLRAKHVQVDERGRVLGYLDWGTAVARELPGFDLLHLLVHARKQLERAREGQTWRRALEPSGLRPGERAALDEHCERCGIDAESARALARIYPVIIGHTAETNWPHTRPGWFRRAFAL